jgi:hypothetical protein
MMAPLGTNGDAARLTPTQRANLIEAAAHGALTNRLWQAALDRGLRE